MSLFKKKDKTEDLSIVNDYKEPFSWRNLWDEQVVGRIKKIHDFLQKNGILFFLLNPFQYKNRLLLKLVLIFAGVLIGVVPRTVGMIHSAKERNAASEIANAGSGTVAGDITVKALASGQHDDTHLLVFNIAGNTSDGVPSTKGGFDVKLAPLRGVTDAQHVKYRYTVIPVDQSNRLLVVYVNNQKQNDTTGIFSLNVHMKSEKGMKTPIEIVLSKGQKNTAVYKNGDIHLAALSNILTENAGTTKHGISDAKKALNKAINVYQVNEQRLNASDMTIGMTTDKIKAFVKSNTIMPNLTDTSTTSEINGLNPTMPDVQTIASTITYKGQTYSDASVNNGTDTDDTDDTTGTTDTVQNQAEDVELPNLTTLVQSVQSALSELNTARLSKYTALLNLETVLNKKLTPSDMSSPKTVSPK